MAKVLNDILTKIESFRGEVPDTTLDAVKAHFLRGEQGGDFVEAALRNEFVAAATRADRKNLDAIDEVARLLYTALPAPAWGSAQQVAIWKSERRSAPFEDEAATQKTEAGAECPVCGNGKLPDGTLSSPEDLHHLTDRTAKNVVVSGDPWQDTGGRLGDYEAIVVFSRSGEDDGSALDDVPTPKYPGLSMGQRLACQLAEELQRAYDLTHMGGRFEVKLIDFRCGKDAPEKLVDDALSLYRVATSHIGDVFSSAGIAGEVLEAVCTLLSGNRLAAYREDELGGLLYTLRDRNAIPPKLTKQIDWC
jgi:hypothetical protein